MFIIDATSDLSDAVARLARLMFNLERGEKVYDWVIGSRPEPDPQPGPNVLTLSIPGVTTSPPTKVDYRPAVGFVYYVPSTPLNVRDLVETLAKLLDGLPHEHLAGPLPVEITAHGSLYHSGRCYPASVVLQPGETPPAEWNLAQLYPTRYFVTYETPTLTPPKHVSYQGAFTWYIMPITMALKIKKFSSFEDVNAIVSAIYFDTFSGGGEPPTPVMSISLDLFNIPPLPTMFARLEGKLKQGTLLIYVPKQGEDAGTFDLAGPKSDYLIPNKWRPPACSLLYEEGPPHPKNLNRPGSTSVCARCSVPLWGDVFAVPGQDRLLSYLALCVWCCGCVSSRVPVGRITTGWTQAQAFRGTKWACVLPLLDASVTKITARGWVGFIATFGDGQRVVIDGCEEDQRAFDGCGEDAAPVCLQYSELRDVRLPCYEWRYGIRVHTERAGAARRTP